MDKLIKGRKATAIAKADGAMFDVIFSHYDGGSAIFVDSELNGFHSAYYTFELQQEEHNLQYLVAKFGLPLAPMAPGCKISSSGLSNKFRGHNGSYLSTEEKRALIRYLTHLRDCINECIEIDTPSVFAN